MNTTTDKRRRGSHVDRRRATRQQILDSAMEVVRTKSFQGATIFEVAKHANLTPGAVQHHFKSKAELMMDIVGEILHTGQSVQPKGAHAGDPPIERAQAYVKALWRTVYEPPRFLVAWNIYFGCTADTEVGAHITQLRAELNDFLHARFLMNFPELQGAHGIHSFIDLVFSALRGIAISRLFGPQDERCNAQLEELAQLIRQRIDLAG